jgi:hypothetical protein
LIISIDSKKINQELNNIESEKEKRIDDMRGEMRVLESEIYKLTKETQTQERAIGRELGTRQLRGFKKGIFYEMADGAFAGRRDKQMDQGWCEGFRNKNLLRMVVKYWKYFTFSKGNMAFENRLKNKIENQIQNELQDRRLVVDALESAIRELEEQKSLEIKKKTIIKSQLDQAYLRGASSTSIQALKMAQSTLNTLYAGVKMPQYNGQNLLAQINLLKDPSKTVTKRVIVSTYNAADSTQN